MDFKTELISYSKTGYFSKIITDYLSQNNSLKDFYQHPFNIEGLKLSIAERKKISTNRKLLFDQLQLQYASAEVYNKVHQNINDLLDENTFTICTAHQPNIFTGHLYFIYKIISFF